jgi:hypothetical protein
MNYFKESKVFPNSAIISDIDLLKTETIPQTETQTEIRMTESFDDYEMKEDHIIEDDDKSVKENDIMDNIDKNSTKKNNQINFKVIKNRNKHLQDTSNNNSNHSEEDKKKKELEMLLDNFNMNLKKKRKATENYIEFLIGKIF